MVLPLWRSNFSLNLMLPKEDRKAMLLRLYNDDTPLMDHSKDRFLKNASAPAEAMTPEPVSDIEMEEAAEKEAAEQLAVAAARDDTNLVSDDDDDDEEEGGVSIRTAGMTAEATRLGSGEGIGGPRGQYGSSSGMDNVGE